MTPETIDLVLKAIIAVSSFATPAVIRALVRRELRPLVHEQQQLARRVAHLEEVARVAGNTIPSPAHA